MKCIIPCGGFGTRISPWTNYICKELLPLNGIPVICHVVGELLECKEIDEIIFVMSPDKVLMKYTLNDYFKDKQKYFNFIVDSTHDGLDNSILMAKQFCQNADATILCWPDCFNMDNEIRNLILHFHGSSLIGVVNVPDVTRYGNIITDGHIIKSIIQKPKTNNTGSSFAYWGKAILNSNFWNKFHGNLDEAFLGESIYELKSHAYDTGNLKDYAKTNYDFTFKK